MLLTCHLPITDSNLTLPLTISLRTFLIRRILPPSLIVLTDLLSLTTLTDYIWGSFWCFSFSLAIVCRS
jgi:hypothetical protein